MDRGKSWSRTIIVHMVNAIITDTAIVKGKKKSPLRIKNAIGSIIPMCESNVFPIYFTKVVFSIENTLCSNTYM